MSAIVGKLLDVAGPPRTRRPSTAYAIAALALIVLTIAGAFAFQAAGIAPCELCLEERLPYYAGVVLGALGVAAAALAPRHVGTVCLAGLALLFVFSAVFGAYHAGIEWGFWPGPTDCTGAPTLAVSSADFLHQLQAVRVVRCDAVAIRILGLSLAGWNVIVSLVVATLAVGGLERLRQP